MNVSDVCYVSETDNAKLVSQFCWWGQDTFSSYNGFMKTNSLWNAKYLVSFVSEK